MLINLKLCALVKFLASSKSCNLLLANSSMLMTFIFNLYFLFGCPLRSKHMSQALSEIA